MSGGELMGRQHESQPVTKSDKVMSKKHKKRRKIIESMQDDKKKLIASMKYNKAHADEHIKAIEKVKKKAKKAGLKITIDGAVQGKARI